MPRIFFADSPQPVRPTILSYLHETHTRPDQLRVAGGAHKANDLLGPARRRHDQLGLAIIERHYLQRVHDERQELGVRVAGQQSDHLLNAAALAHLLELY